MASKKEKKLEKALKLAGIDKEKWDDVLELISDDEKENEVQDEEPKDGEEVETSEEKKDEPKLKEEPKEKEVEEDKPNNENELDIDTILEKLGIEQIKSVVSNQAKEIDELKKQVQKSTVAGAQSKKTQDDEDDEYNFDNLFNKLSSSGVRYTK